MEGIELGWISLVGMRFRGIEVLVLMLQMFQYQQDEIMHSYCIPSVIRAGRASGNGARC